MNIDAMKQALAALEKSVSTCFDRYSHEQVLSRPEHFINQTITALRLAIEQAEKQEPVGYFTINDYDKWEQIDGTSGKPLYEAPQPCLTCEALARTVMMDQTGRDA